MQTWAKASLKAMAGVTLMLEVDLPRDLEPGSLSASGDIHDISLWTTRVKYLG